MSTCRILLLYYSRNGHVAEMARIIARGIHEVENCEAVIRTVPPVSPDTGNSLPAVPEDGPPYCTLTDLEHCHGLVLGSPSRFGNMAAPLKHFLDTTGNLWFSGALSGKPAGVFVSAASMHGGHESTQLSMMIPLLHHGMLIVGVPPECRALRETRSGGTPYGPSHVDRGDATLDEHEKAICLAFGRRVAHTAVQLS